MHLADADLSRDLGLRHPVEEPQPQDELLALGKRGQQIVDHHLVLDLVHARLVAPERVAERAVVAGKLRVEGLRREGAVRLHRLEDGLGVDLEPFGDLGHGRRTSELVGELADRRGEPEPQLLERAGPGRTTTGPGSGA